MTTLSGTNISVAFRSNSPAYNAVLVTLGILLTFTVVIGNFLVIATFLKTENRKPAYYLLSSLAFVDFLAGLTAIPVETYRRVVLTEVTCIYHIYVHIVSGTLGLGSLFHLMLVTVDRYIAVNKPLRYETIVTSKRIAIVIAVTWGNGVVALVTCVLVVQRIPPLISPYCAETNTHTYFIARVINLLAITVFLLLQIALITLNASILRIAMRHANRIAQMEQAVGQNGTGSHVKAAKTMTLITVGFFICYMPLNVYVFFLGIDTKGSLYSRPFEDFTYYMLLCNSAINPIVYCYRDRTLRENARKYFKDKAAWKNLCSARSTFIQVEA